MNMYKLLLKEVFFIVINQRGENVPKVLVFSIDGDFIQAWNTTTLEMPHGIFLANALTNPSIWITDVGSGGLYLRGCIN